EPSRARAVDSQRRLDVRGDLGGSLAMGLHDEAGGGVRDEDHREAAVPGAERILHLSGDVDELRTPGRADRELAHRYETSASAKSCGSNGRRSSSPSPTPTSFTGRPSSYAIATAMPPFAEPSSFVSATPVTPTASLKSRACCSPFWPVVASTTSSVSCGAPSSFPAITRRTLASSSIRFACVCRRPAVSTTTTSLPRDSAAPIAS